MDHRTVFVLDLVRDDREFRLETRPTPGTQASGDDDPGTFPDSVHNRDFLTRMVRISD